MKKYLIGSIITFVTIFGIIYAVFLKGFYIDLHPDKQVSSSFQTEGNKIMIPDDKGKLAPFIIKGVDVSASMPGQYSTTFAPEEEDYLRWFKSIREMGGNTVKAYTIMDDDFYNAFYRYNQEHQEPLYLLQGILVSDEANMNAEDAYSEDFYDQLIKDGITAVDIIHGKRIILNNKMRGSGSYFKDISPWVIGYLVGNEWNSATISYTDHQKRYASSWSGTYFETSQDATVFESMLAKIMDTIISYESKKYKQQRLISFINDPSNDPFHYKEAYEKQLGKYSYIDAEHIVPTEKLESGYFVSYKLYDYCTDYSAYLSDEQKIKLGTVMNTLDKTDMYAGYMKLLSNYHTMPIVVGGYGFSTARAPIQKDTQPLTEEKQGDALMKVYRQALEDEWAGVFISTWQDTWERRSWNTAFSTVITQNYLWHDLQSDGQNYGIMAFESKGKKDTSFVDGDDSEWLKEKPIIENEGLSIYSRQDREGLYLLLKGEDLEQKKLFLPIDVTPVTGSTKAASFEQLEFDRASDFLLCLDGMDNTRLLVQERYNALRENFLAEITGEDPFIFFPDKDSDVFEIHGTALSNNTLVDESIVDAHEIFSRRLLGVWDSGRLVHGNGNPKHKEYNSLSDFCFGDSFVEICIPWSLLNVCDPTLMQIADDYYEHYGMLPRNVSEFWIGVGDSSKKIQMKPMKMQGFMKAPEWKERLKKSYYIIQKEWKGVGDASIQY